MEVDPAPYLLYDGGLVRIFVMVLTVLIGLHLQDFYSRFHVQSRIVLLQDLCVAVGWAFLLQGLISYLDPDLKAPHTGGLVGQFADARRHVPVARVF